jgi:hypothetical protein
LNEHGVLWKPGYLRFPFAFVYSNHGGDDVEDDDDDDGDHYDDGLFDVSQTACSLTY